MKSINANVATNANVSLLFHSASFIKVSLYFSNLFHDLTNAGQEYTALQLPSHPVSRDETLSAQVSDNLAFSDDGLPQDDMSIEEDHTYSPVVKPVSYPIPIDQLANLNEMLTENHQAVLKRQFAVCIFHV